jgi:flagellar biosynthetic protein FlhB
MPGDRTEQATPQHREKARKDGDLLFSRELTGAAGMTAGVMTLGWFSDRAIEAWRTGCAAFLDLGTASRWEGPQLAPTLSAIRRLSIGVLAPAGVVMASVASAAALTAVMQTGGQINVKAISIRIDRISPLANIRNLFSIRAAARLGKSLIPASLLAVFAVQRIAGEAVAPSLSISRLEALGRDAYGLLLTAAWLLLGWAVVDYAVEWRSRESRLRMSRDDLREEFKETEGNPQIRSRIRGLQRQLRRRKVKAEVSRAAVVVTNPTHYAVALAFDFETMDAPKVLAKGRNLLAEEIKAEARWAGVEIVENPPLARSLYRSVEVGKPIPVDLYAAVAAILAFLYRERVAAEMRDKRTREAREGATAHSGERERPGLSKLTTSQVTSARTTDPTSLGGLL